MKMRMAILMLMVLALLGCEEEQKWSEPVRPVRVVTVDGQVNPETRTFPGKVKATREATLAFRISGQIVKLRVKEGDSVKKGQLIAQLDQRDYQAAIADLEARLAGARSVLKEASLNIERNRKLLAGNIIAQSDFDAALSNFETSRANVLSLEQSLRRARLNLQYTSLTAPFDGTIAVKEVDNHEFVQAKEPIVQLEDTSSLDVVMDVPESVWVRGFDAGNTTLIEAVATFETLPGKTFPLRVKEFQTKANPGTQTYEVTLNMDNAEGLGVHPGMTAEVAGALPENGENGAGSVAVPFASVTGSPDGEKHVWILGEDNTVSKREVRLGRIMKEQYVLDSGVSPGERIVVAGVNYLREGQKVKVLTGRIGGRQ